MNEGEWNAMLKSLICVAATSEPGEDPEVVRAKYYIRDEFLVSRQFVAQNL